MKYTSSFHFNAESFQLRIYSKRTAGLQITCHT